MVLDIPGLKLELVDLGKLAEEEDPTKQKLRDKKQAVYYFMEKVIRLGFGSVLW